jgi:hypothetical protein
MAEEENAAPATPAVMAYTETTPSLKPRMRSRT